MLVGRLMGNGAQLNNTRPQKIWDSPIDSTDYSTLHNLLLSVYITFFLSFF